MPVKDALIRAQELGGRWTSIGSDAARGIVVEDLSADADSWGPRSCSFTLRRDPRVPWPDIGAYAPLEIESQGLPIWSGRVKGTPTSDGPDRRLTVNGEGWQYHLDDDSFQHLYVDSNVGNWVDARSFTTATLGGGGLVVAGQVSGSGGILNIGFPATIARGVQDKVGIRYDAGQNSGVGAVSFTIRTSNNNAGNTILRAYASNDPTFTTSTNYFSRFLDIGSAPGIGPGAIAYDFATAGERYLFIRIECLAGFTPAADSWVAFDGIRVFGSSAYETSGLSQLRASVVVADAFTRGTLLLSSSQSKLTATSFDIPDFNMTKPDTARNVINAVNTYHSYQARVTVDKLLEYRPLPANPTTQVDTRSTFDEASAGDASEIYSGVIVNYTEADGTPGSVQRSQPTVAYYSSAIQPTNPSATVNTTGWTAVAGTLSRDTVVFDTTPASFKVAMASFGGPGYANLQMTGWTGGTWVAGHSYVLQFAERIDTPASTLPVVAAAWVIDSNGTNIGTVSASSIVAATWTTYQVAFTLQTAAAPSLNFFGYGASSASNMWIDSLVLNEAAATIVDRRGFRRTFVLDTNMSLTPAAAQQIGDVFLTQHKTVPLKGKIVVTGYGAATKTPSGVSMPASELLLNTGELVRLIHLIDPDTGAIGREGRVASVSWDALSDTATIEIDSQSTNFEAFLGRLGILTGQVK